MAKQGGGVGPMIAVIVIVIILGIGGVYYLLSEVKTIRQNGGASTALNINLYK